MASKHCNASTSMQRESSVNACTDQLPRQTERSSIVDYVNRALRHHNAHNPGAEFEPVKALVYASVGFRRARWVHVGFLARKRSTENTRARPVKPPENAAGAAAAGDDPDLRRGRERRRRSGMRDEAPEPPDSQFFAELRFDDYDSAAVVACTIIDKSTPRGFKTKCGFCPESFGILHPGDGKFACGKRSQRNEFFLLRNRLLLPYTWPKKESEEEEPCPGPDRRNLGWIPTPLTFSENSHQGFSCLLLVSYCLDRVWHVHDVNWSR
uniref:Uncharacterized protein n=1 Tax=Oryza brachyantha TaxID=4533 RepID=J3LER7_ORYBR